nr:MAG TPA: hypothetical protein [Caudoviricetes sp.]
MLDNANESSKISWRRFLNKLQLNVSLAGKLLLCGI